MKILVSNFSLILILFMLFSCGAKNTKYYAVKHYQPRESNLGFSITPPPGDHWYEKLKKTISKLKNPCLPIVSVINSLTRIML